MRLHNVCLSLCSWMQKIQAFDPAYNAYGAAYPDFKSAWSDQLFSLIYTRAGRDPSPENTTSRIPGFENSLRGKFLAALENRFCRLNYQQTLEQLEAILDDAIAKHGEEKIAALMDSLYVPSYGNEFAGRLESAGLVIRDKKRLERLCKKAQEIQNNRNKQGFNPNP